MIMKETKIVINEQEYIIKKLALGKYVKLIKALKGSSVLKRLLEEDLSNVSNISMNELAQLLPELLSEAWPDVLKLIAIASDIDEKKIEEEFGLDDGVLIITAIFEVNNFAEIKKNIERLLPKNIMNKAEEYQKKMSLKQ